MASGASARTLFSPLVAAFILALVAVPANAATPGPDCAGEEPTIRGSNVGEWITGTEGDDIIRAGAGDDTINGLGGNDTICAGPGDDTTRAGQGNDRVRSGRGNDSSSGEAGDDDMRGQGDTDLADGGVGIDRCLFETHSDCEADLDLTLTGPANALTGGPEVSTYHLDLANHGPSPAVKARVDLALPARAAFLPATSDPRCSATAATLVRCNFGSMGVDVPSIGADITLVFAGCEEGPAEVAGEAQDPITDDHVPPNNARTVTTALSESPVCINDPPTAVDDTATVDEDSGANTIDVLANDTDVDGGSLSVQSKTDGSHGTVAITNGGADVSYTPDADYCNSGPPPGDEDTFTYALNGGSTATVTVTVTCVDDDPEAVDDSATVGEDSGANQIDVLNNDNNPDGGPISVASKTNGTHGTVAITNAGADVSYTPDADYCNSGPPPGDEDTFDYTLNGGSTATVTVTVTCVDDDPEAVDDEATVGEDSGANTIDVLNNDLNPDGGPISVASKTNGTHGTVAITNSGADVSYTPDADYCGPDLFTYSLAPGGSAATVFIDVTCVDDDPEAVDDEASVDEDSGANTIDVLANDNNPDGGPISVASKTNGTHGTVAITNSGADVSYTPDADYCGPDLFTYSLAPGGSAATVFIDVTCDDDPPTAVDDSATVDEDSGANTIDVLANDTDPDGGPISVASKTNGTHGTVAITNSGADVSYAPDADYCNSGPPPGDEDTFTYTINGGSTATVTVTVTCDDDPPTAVDDTATVDEDSGANTIDVLANDNDSDGGPLTVESKTDGSHGTVAITNAGADVSYTPDADYCNSGPPPGDEDTFTYALNGGSTATVTVTVTCIDDDPEAVDDSATVDEDSGANTIDVLNNDLNADGGPLTVQSKTDGSDGTVAITNSGADVSYTPNPDYCNDPPASSLDTFTYTINGGSTATVTVTVTCVDDDPEAVDDEATVGEDSGANTIDALANDTDVDGGSLSVQSKADGSHGTVAITNGGADVSYTPEADYCNSGPPPGDEDTFTYTIDGGSTATVTVTVTCVDDDPTAVDDTATTPEDQAVSIDVLSNDQNSDGGPLEVQSKTDGSHGTVAITNAGADVSYTPDADYCNDGPPSGDEDTFDYTLNGGSTATVTVTVTCVDDDPEAVDDSATVDEDSGANTIDVLANDTDPDGGPISVASKTNGTHGTVAITNSGADVSYAPDADYCNSGPPPGDEDTFTYTINGGSTATVTVTVTCDDDPPTAVDDTATVDEDSGANTIDVLANDNDSDGGPLTVESKTDGSHGTVAITNAGADVSYTPDADYCNSGPPPGDEDTFTYALNGGSTATVTVTVTCIDDDPEAVDDSATVDEDSGANTIDVLNNDLNADGGPLTVQSKTDGSDGTVAITNSGADVSYTPNPDYCNDPPASSLDTFTYTINGGSTATVTVTVTCVDDDPEAVDDEATVGEDSGANTIDALANDTDVDGGSLSVQSKADGSHGTVAITNGGADVSYTPEADYCNSGPPPGDEDTFTYTIDGGSTATVTVTVTCVDDDPTAVDDTATTPEDQAVSIDVLSNDQNSDGGPLEVQSKTDGSHGTVAITNAGADVSYTPDADYCNDGPPSGDEDTFDYTLNGGSTATVTVTVTCVDDDPTAVDDSATTDAFDPPLTVDVLANDNNPDGSPFAVNSVTQGTFGSVTIGPGGSNVTYNYDQDAFGCSVSSDSFTYTLAPGGSTATVTIDITCSGG